MSPYRRAREVERSKESTYNRTADSPKLASYSITKSMAGRTSRNKLDQQFYTQEKLNKLSFNNIIKKN